MNYKIQALIIERCVPVPEAGCWLWERSTNRRGYGSFYFEGAHFKAHRASYQAFVSPIADDKCVLHKCDTPSCVNPSHLFIGTNLDNVQDRTKKGRGVLPDNKGERNGMAKLTSEVVNEIRRRHHAGETKTHISKLFGISRQHVSDLVSGKKWSWLDTNLPTSSGEG